jgi:tellurite resistance protein/uncharacterized protein (DUF697 family)
MLQPAEAEAVVTLALMAALSDGRSDPTERDQLKSLLQSLAADEAMPSLASIHQRVVLNQVRPSDVIAALKSPEARSAAFEIAVCVVDADGKTTSKEQAFLDELEKRLGLSHNVAVAFERDAEAIALADPTDGPTTGQEIDLFVPEPPTVRSQARAPAPAAPVPAIPSGPNPAETDRIILKYAILNGALELLPQNLATMAILPLQTRMVYTIGKRHGYTLGPGHIKEFIATLGLGATSQMLENFARKTLGSLAKKHLGKTAGKVVKHATGPMMTFASTFAIGRVAEAYYRGGRQMSAVDLRSLFQRDLASGKALYEQHRPSIEQQASTLDAGRVLDLVRGKGSMV